MSKSIFISYVYEDKTHRDKLKEWSDKKLFGEKVTVTYEREDYRNKGEKAVKQEILSMIQGATVVIFLIGENTHNHPWVNYEAECAVSKNKKILLFRIPNTSGGKPPHLKAYPEYIMDPNKIKTLIQNE